MEMFSVFSLEMKREPDQYFSRSLSRKIIAWRRVLKFVAHPLVLQCLRNQQQGVTLKGRE